MRLSGKRILIFAADQYEEMELQYPRYRLMEEGAEVTIAGVGPDVATGKHGYPVSIDANAADLSADDFDAVVVPGGYAPDKLRRYDSVLGIVRAMNDAGKPVAAICHAAWVPVSAGILKGRRVTCVTAIKDDVINAGAEYVDEPVVVDGNLVTSRTPDDLPVWLPALIEAIEKAGR